VVRAHGRVSHIAAKGRLHNGSQMVREFRSSEELSYGFWEVHRHQW
jgi:hypothetical protein